MLKVKSHCLLSVLHPFQKYKPGCDSHSNGDYIIYCYSDLNLKHLVILTSVGLGIFFLDGGVELERQLRCGAQERLNDCGAFEGVPVSRQVALRLADLQLHGRLLPFLQTDLPGDGDVRLLPFAGLEIDHQSLQTPEGRERGAS